MVKGANYDEIKGEQTQQTDRSSSKVSHFDMYEKKILKLSRPSNQSVQQQKQILVSKVGMMKLSAILSKSKVKMQSIGEQAQLRDKKMNGKIMSFTLNGKMTKV